MPHFTSHLTLPRSAKDLDTGESSAEHLLILGQYVGTATGYELDGPGIESRWKQRLFANVQTCPDAHLGSCTMGTGSFPGVKAAGAWRCPPAQSRVEVKKE